MTGRSFASNALLTGDGSRIKTPAALPDAAKVLQVNADGTSTFEEISGGASSSASVIQSLTRKLQEIGAGDEESVKVMTIGDSLAAGAFRTYTSHAMNAFVSWLSSETYYTETDGLLEGILGATTGQFTSSNGAVRYDKTDYDVSFVGISTHIASGQSTLWAFGNLLVFADEILVPVVTKPGAGSIKIEVSASGTTRNGATFRNPLQSEIESGHTLTGVELIIDADAAKGLDSVRLSVPIGRYAIRVSHEAGGAVQILDPHFSVVNASAVNLYRIGAGSNNFGNSLAEANVIMAALIDAYDPDLLVIESDDSSSAYQNFLPMLSDCLDLCETAKPSVLLSGNPGIGSGFGVTEPDLATRIEYCKEFAEPRRWDVIDGLGITGGYEELVRLGIGGDGVHLTTEAWEIPAKDWIETRGYENLDARPPGGLVADTVDALAGVSDRLIRALDTRAILSNPYMIDSGTMSWSYFLSAASNPLGVRNPSFIRIRSGFTAGGTASAYIGESNTPIGLDNGAFAQVTPFLALSGAVLMPAVMSANSVAWLTCQFRYSTTQYYGPLTGSGFGFKIVGGLMYGAWWDGGVQLTPTGVDLNDGPTMRWNYWQILSENTGNTNQRLSFYVNRNLLGTATYVASGTARPMRFEVANTSDSANCEMYFLPPRYVN